jgi:hypothetical protein
MAVLLLLAPPFAGWMASDKNTPWLACWLVPLLVAGYWLMAMHPGDEQWWLELVMLEIEEGVTVAMIAIGSWIRVRHRYVGGGRGRRG